MSKDRGYYVEYTDKSGAQQKAMVYYVEQEQSFKNIKKLLCRLVDDNLEFKTDANGKKLISLVAQDKCRVIGYFD